MAEYTYHVYGLLCPLVEKIRYVGQSRKVAERYKTHVRLHDLNKSRDRRVSGLPLQPKHLWLLDLQKRGLAPELVIVETLTMTPEYYGGTPRAVVEAERRWISRLLDAGHPLTNSAHDLSAKPSPEDATRLVAEAEERGRNLVLSLGKHSLSPRER